MDPKAISEQALAEVRAEQYRAAVEREKERLRKRVPLLHRLFPFKITITRRDACSISRK